MIGEDSLKQHIVEVAIPGSFTTVAMAFIQESIIHMIPWLIVTCAMILCDLAFGIRCSLILGEKVRFSSATRRTMGKMVTYFAFVAMVCFISVATDMDNKIDIYSCLLVCFIEGCSIISNIIKPKGYILDLDNLLVLIGRKMLKVDKSDLEDVITKNKEDKP